MIAILIFYVKFSFWILKLFMLDVPHHLFMTAYANVAEVFETKDTNNEMVNDVSDDSAYETAEEETPDDFYDSHQYVRWELPPEALDFYPRASLFALHGVPYKWPSSPPTYFHDLPPPKGFLSFPSEFIPEPMIKGFIPKKPSEKRLHGLQREKVLTPLTDDSDASHETTTEESDVESRESKVTFERPLTDEFENEWVRIPRRDYSDTSFGFESTEEKVTEESIESCVESTTL